MKVQIIKACASSPFKDYKKFMAAPPQSIFSLAASTPKDIEIELIDETIDMLPNYETDAGLIAIFFSTPDAIRGYEIADDFRAMGKKVVLGGLHVKFNQEEALKHADSLLIGETEGIWETLLEDYSFKRLQSKYERTEPVELSSINKYPTDLIPIGKFNYVWSVVVSRGCVNQCSYCLVHKFFNEEMRFRPVDDVVEEIRLSGAKIVELHSDNLTANRDYALELFTKLIPLNIKWVAETTADFADDDELLKLAALSGLSYLLLGLETPSKQALENADKEFLSVSRVKEQLKKLHQYNIVVDSGMLFGFDSHTEDIFDESINYVRNIELDVPHGIIPIPFPGSNFYKQLEEEGRILTKDWSKYDGRHLVYKHPHLNEKEITEGIQRFEQLGYTIRGYMRYQRMLWRLGVVAML